MDKNRHHCAGEKPCDCAPSDKELYLLGFESWQVSILRKLPPSIQWEAHDEFIRRLMSNETVEDLRF